MIDILDFIPYGTTDEPMKREDLVRLTNLNDREVRDAIEGAKANGYPVVNVGNGYYIPDDPNDPNLMEYNQRETSRALKILKGTKAHRRMLKIDLNQEVLDL